MHSDEDIPDSHIGGSRQHQSQSPPASQAALVDISTSSSAYGMQPRAEPLYDWTLRPAIWQTASPGSAEAEVSQSSSKAQSGIAVQVRTQEVLDALRRRRVGQTLMERMKDRVPNPMRESSIQNARHLCTRLNDSLHLIYSAPSGCSGHSMPWDYRPSYGPL